jgi:hypothetical protein
VAPGAWLGYPQAYPAPGDADAGAPATQTSEHVRWLQDCLNSVMSTQLPVDGVMSAATRSVVRNFQRQRGLRVTGIAGPDTEDALRSACQGAPVSGDGGADRGGDADQGSEQEFGDWLNRIKSGVGGVLGRVTEALGGCRIIDLTAQSDRSVRKGTRDPKTVYALVLHQMACCFRRRDPLKSYLKIKAHFAILPEGQILQLHPVSALIWASHGLNARSVAVEFAGNFPNIHGKWWKGETYGRNRPTPAQLEAGRCLVRHLIRTMGLRVILAHRQSSNMRGNDPGPEVWYHVGQWALDNLGLSDGGPGFKIGTGAPIPDAWRTWGRSGGTPATPELELDEAEVELESWRGAPEGVVASEVTLPQAIADPRAASPGIYTIYRQGQRLYVGRARQLRRRLQQHLWCLTHLGVGVEGYSVKLTPMHGASPAQLQRVEAAVIGRYGRQAQGGALSNVKARELEQELFEITGSGGAP